jgi:hypothetical protein
MALGDMEAIRYKGLSVSDVTVIGAIAWVLDEILREPTLTF